MFFIHHRPSIELTTPTQSHASVTCFLHGETSLRLHPKRAREVNKKLTGIVIVSFRSSIREQPPGWCHQNFPRLSLSFVTIWVQRWLILCAPISKSTESPLFTQSTVKTTRFQPLPCTKQCQAIKNLSV